MQSIITNIVEMPRDGTDIKYLCRVWSRHHGKKVWARKRERLFSYGNPQGLEREPSNIKAAIE